MISKEEFVDIINKLKQVNDFVNEVNEKARKLEGTTIGDFFNVNSVFQNDDIILKLLENMFNDVGETLAWWMLELDYGREFKLGDFRIDDKPIDISTPEKLYDYLIKGVENE